MFAPFNLFSSLRRDKARRSAIQELRNLPAAQLRDIGLAPDQLDQVVGATLNRWEFDRRHSAASVWGAFLSSGSVPRHTPLRI